MMSVLVLRDRGPGTEQNDGEIVHDLVAHEAQTARESGTAPGSQ
jgi:hypothetical protein